MINVFWHQCDNFGDKLTPYILDKLGIEYRYVNKNHDSEHYILCGSILPACNEHSIIWGAGIAQDQEIKKPKEVLAVRGVLTREMMLRKGVDCPEIYGDAAMILPLLYVPKIEKSIKVGVIPHVVDQYLYNDYWDLNSKVEETIDYICSCEKIVSSSFHAILTAHVYGVPYEIIISENVIGADMKFKDFLNTKYDLDKFISACPFKEKLINHSHK